MSSVVTRAARCLLAFSLCSVGAGCASASQTASVTILVPWSGAEFSAFLAVVKPFEQQHGVQVNVESSRALTQDLDADLAAHAPPDLADLPSPAAVYQYKNEEGALKPLSIPLNSYAQPWRDLAEAGTGTAYAVPIKADIKSLLWYYTRAPSPPPRNWAGLENLSHQGNRWCLGLASGSTSGWPGADWVAQILLSTYQADTYENWLSGGLSWKSADVQDAWNKWGALMGYGAAVNGGQFGALKTAFNEAAGGMASGQCELGHGALSATGLTPSAGYRYELFPPISGAMSPILVSGDFMGLFTDNSNAKNLLAYLASNPAQKLWVEQAGGYAFSADQAVKPAAYPAGVEYDIAKLLQPADGTPLCFSAEDMMQPNMSTAFEQAVLDYVNDHNSLTGLLKDLQRTQNAAGHSPSPLANHACEKP